MVVLVKLVLLRRGLGSGILGVMLDVFLLGGVLGGVYFLLRCLCSEEKHNKIPALALFTLKRYSEKT